MILTPKQHQEWVENNKREAEEKRLKEQKKREIEIKKYIPKRKKK